MSWERFEKKEAQSERNQGNKVTPKTPVAKIPKEIAFEFFHTSEEGEVYQGTFVVKRPTILDLQEIEGVRAAMLNGYYYDPSKEGCGVSASQHMSADMIAFLRVTLKEAPDWWKKGEIYDREVIAKLFQEAIAVDPLRKRLFASVFSEGAVREVGEGGHPERVTPNDRDAFAEMVGTEVP